MVELNYCKIKINVQEKEFDVNKENDELIINNLAEKGIETRPFFHPLHLQPAIKEMNLKRTPLPVSEKIGRQGFYIPIGKHVKPKLQKNIVLAIKNAIDEIG